ncbi:hypothetical protein SUGI_0832010 [Cryptomeria japonica]|uniref:fasciclin-like arabinogalactan protein 7 n=1 Tax=Cryptomeria japonica TaxID=3369 RepID=UPI002414B2C4|nr:fasciclin-like arabinogalactan protein 7 [Cryptomeria japonica]GLJ40402.1 hypothetical protein SUGI_0832010 [Cryptomeria japonica]
MAMAKAKSGLGWVIMVALVAVAMAGEKKASVTLSPTPAPAPAPAAAPVNVTDLLLVAGPLQTFLYYLDGKDMMKTVEDQANTTNGLSMFVPTNAAFANLKKATLANLTDDQMKALILSHCIPKFYTLSDFQNFSNPANTMATGMNGGKYNLNITAKSGTVSLSSGYVTSPIASTVHVTYPLALYSVPKVMLPEDIFGLPSPSLAPSPAPDVASPEPVSSDSPSSSTSSPTSSASSSPKSAPDAAAAPVLTTTVRRTLLLAVAGPLLMLL